MTSKFLQRHDSREASVFKRTRSSTRKFLEKNKISLDEIKTVDEKKIFFFRLNGRKHEIVVELVEEEIIAVSCADCSGEFRDKVSNVN